MATIRRGRRAGQHAAIQAFANDWFDVDYADGKHGIEPPTNMQLDEGEQQFWLDDPVGMDREFQLHADGTFTRLARPPRRSVYGRPGAVS